MWIAIGIVVGALLWKDLKSMFFPLLAFVLLLSGVGFYQDGRIPETVACITISAFIFSVIT